MRRPKEKPTPLNLDRPEADLNSPSNEHEALHHLHPGSSKPGTRDLANGVDLNLVQPGKTGSTGL